MRPCKTRSRPRYSTINIPPYAEHTQAQVLQPLKDNDEHERNLKQYRITANHKKWGWRWQGQEFDSCGGVGINTIHDKLSYILTTTDFEIVKIVNQCKDEG